jgi:hypothetical protein
LRPNQLLPKLCGLVAVAILLSAVVSTFQMSGFSIFSPNPDCLHGSFAIPPKYSAPAFVATANTLFDAIKDFPSESAEQEQFGISPSTPLAYNSPLSSAHVPDGLMRGTIRVRSVYPMRC